MSGTKITRDVSSEGTKITRDVISDRYSGN